MTIEQYTEEIHQICQELEEAAEDIGQMGSVSHLSKSFIQFNGGILGAIQEHKEGKRLKRLLNAPFYKEWSYYQFAFYIIECAGRLVEKQLEVQKMTTPDNPVYFGNVRLISNSVNTVREAWRLYSPDMANELLTIAGQEDVALWPTVYGWTKKEIIKLDLPSNLQWLKRPEREDSGGCLGMMLALLLMPISLMLLLLFTLQ